MKRLIAMILCAVIGISCCACGKKEAGETTIEATNQTTEALTTQKNVEPIVEGTYEITNILTPFSHDRAWVQYGEGEQQTVALIDKNAYQVFSIAESELTDWDTNWLGASAFVKGASSLFPDCDSIGSRADRPGMIIVTRDGKVVFDSRTADESTKYYHLGTSTDTFLFAKHVANYSTNKWYIGEMDESGKELYTKEYTGEINLTEFSEFTYYGEDIFIADYDDIVGHPNRLAVYNRSSKALFSTYQVTQKYGEVSLLSLTEFKNGKALGELVWSTGEVAAWISITKSDLQNEGSWKNYNFEKNSIPLLPEYMHVNEGFINYNPPKNRTTVVIDEKEITKEPGIYNESGDLIVSYPKDWRITQVSAFSGGYAMIVLIGKDKERYVTVVDSKGKQQYDPLKVDTAYDWHGYVLALIDEKEVFLDPKGKETDISEIDAVSDTYTFGTYDCRYDFYEGYRLDAKPDSGPTFTVYLSFSNNKGDKISTVKVLSNYDEVAGQATAAE